jgi:hypothetical protein
LNTKVIDKNITGYYFFLPAPRVPVPPKPNDGAEDVGNPPAAGVVPKPNEVVVEGAGAPKPNEGAIVVVAPN